MKRDSKIRVKYEETKINTKNKYCVKDKETRIVSRESWNYTGDKRPILVRFSSCYPHKILLEIMYWKVD